MLFQLKYILNKQIKICCNPEHKFSGWCPFTTFHSADSFCAEFWHIEIETLPYFGICTQPVITTFLHGMYCPKRDVFTHIDYTKNQYSGNEYLQKYADSIDGMPIDQYTSCRDLHYKIWCIENGEFTRETWYKLFSGIVSVI